MDARLADRAPHRRAAAGCRQHARLLPEEAHDTPEHGDHRSSRHKPAAAPAPARRRCPHGASAARASGRSGYREPLNANEQAKKDDNPLNVRTRIETIYAHRGFASIDPSDLRNSFRWWGLYTQRRPGIDGGRTAVLEPWELDDEYFMLRIRIDGGQLSTAQLRVIGQISTEFARDTADITDRQNIQLHWIRVEDMPEIWSRLEAVGLGTQEACGDARGLSSAVRSPASPPTS